MLNAQCHVTLKQSAIATHCSEFAGIQSLLGLINMRFPGGVSFPSLLLLFFSFFYIWRVQKSDGVEHIIKCASIRALITWAEVHSLLNQASRSKTGCSMKARTLRWNLEWSCQVIGLKMFQHLCICKSVSNMGVFAPTKPIIILLPRNQVGEIVVGS